MEWTFLCEFFFFQLKTFSILSYIDKYFIFYNIRNIFDFRHLSRGKYTSLPFT